MSDPSIRNSKALFSARSPGREDRQQADSGGIRGTPETVQALDIESHRLHGQPALPLPHELQNGRQIHQCVGVVLIMCKTIQQTCLHRSQIGAGKGHPGQGGKANELRSPIVHGWQSFERRLIRAEPNTMAACTNASISLLLVR